MKKKQQRMPQKKQEDTSPKLGDMINSDILAKLRETQKELSQAEQVKKEAEEEKKREERKLREKNKSFEELLGESNLDWKKYK